MYSNSVRIVKICDIYYTTNRFILFEQILVKVGKFLSHNILSRKRLYDVSLISTHYLFDVSFAPKDDLKIVERAKQTNVGKLRQILEPNICFLVRNQKKLYRKLNYLIYSIQYLTYITIKMSYLLYVYYTYWAICLICE